jgi:hypothetical protein
MVAIKALGWWVAYLDQDIFCLSPIGGILCFKILTSLKKLVLANDFKAHQHRLWGWQGRARTWDTWVISPFLGWYWTRYPCSASPKQRMTIVCPLCAQSLLLMDVCWTCRHSLFPAICHFSPQADPCFGESTCPCFAGFFRADLGEDSPDFFSPSRYRWTWLSWFSRCWGPCATTWCPWVAAMVPF